MLGTTSWTLPARIFDTVDEAVIVRRRSIQDTWRLAELCDRALPTMPSMMCFLSTGSSSNGLFVRQAEPSAADMRIQAGYRCSDEEKRFTSPERIGS